MEHFLYVIEEKDGTNDICSSQVIKELYMTDTESEPANCSERAAVELNYEINTTVPSLNKIMDYYKIPTRENRKELRKSEKVKRIVDFETCEDNQDIVKRRKLYWDYISELKQDEYFKKYIAFDL
tara:strand:+ start:246 stop:620 length:375 start_codon:yes stop_codon:yes gene_type:complete